MISLKQIIGAAATAGALSLMPMSADAKVRGSSVEPPQEVCICETRPVFNVDAAWEKNFIDVDIYFNGTCCDQPAVLPEEVGAEAVAPAVVGDGGKTTLRKRK
jgi:hypothetical protein